MPRRIVRHNRGRRTKVRRHYKRKTRGNIFNHITSKTSIRPMQQIFPDRFCCKLRNRFNLIFTGTSGATNGFCSYGNALHNSQSNGVISGSNAITATNPISIYGLANMLSSDGSSFNSVGPYLGYRIISSGLRWQGQNTSTTNNADSATFVILPMTLQALNQLPVVSSLTALQLSELPYSKMQTVSGLSVNSGFKGRHAMSTARQFALKYKSSLEDDQYTGVYGTNPTQVWSWVFAWFPQTSANTSATIIVTQEYYVEFYNRNNLAQGTG